MADPRLEHARHGHAHHHVQGVGFWLGGPPAQPPDSEANQAAGGDQQHCPGQHDR